MNDMVSIRKIRRSELLSGLGGAGRIGAETDGVVGGVCSSSVADAEGFAVADFFRKGNWLV
jgi:hypothetical protein